jgi:MFS transporter, ACS family, D-galactonate transporter
MHSPSFLSLSPLIRWRIVLMMMVFAGLAHFNRVGISVAGDEVFLDKKVGVSETQMGWVYTTFLIVYTIGMLPGGWLIDRIGAAKSLTLLGLTMGTFVALTGTLGWLTHTPASLWLGLLVVRGIAGLCNSPLHPGAAHVVSDLMPPRWRATANGMVTAGALIGIACCYPIFGWLIDKVSWPWAFIHSGGILIAYGMIWRLFAQPSLPTPQPAPTVVKTLAETETGWLLLRQSNLWLLALSYAAFGYFQYLFFYWMGYYFKEVLHVPNTDARQASFYIMLAQGAGMAIGGFSTDGICKLLGATWGRRSIVLCGMCLAALFGLIGVSLDGYWTISFFLALSMASLGICEGVFWTTATDLGGKSRGFSGAFMNTLGNVGGLISPVLTPILAKGMGWPGAIGVACAISGIGGLVWFWIQIPQPAPEKTAEYDATM